MGEREVKTEHLEDEYLSIEREHMRDRKLAYFFSSFFPPACKGQKSFIFTRPRMTTG